MGKRIAILYKDSESVNIVYEDQVENRGYFVLHCPTIDCNDNQKIELHLNNQKYMTLNEAIELAKQQ